MTVPQSFLSNQALVNSFNNNLQLIKNQYAGYSGPPDADVTAILGYQSITDISQVQKIHETRIKLTEAMPTLQDLDDPMKYKKTAWYETLAHQFGNILPSNKKYVSLDGRQEWMVDSSGNILTVSSSPSNAGSYNFIPNGGLSQTAGHWDLDVLPWIRFGNSSGDTTSEFQRNAAFCPPQLKAGLPLAGPAAWVAAALTEFGKAILNASPLVFDLDGDGIELSTLAGSQVFWDINVDGFREQTGWVNADDGFLAIDLNQNGSIDDHSELFGTATIDGFSILSAYDSDGDGRITASDAQFGALMIWQDINQDGRSDVSELQSLSALNITEIDLNATQVTQTNAGHSVSHTSTYTYIDGTGAAATRAVHDVWFEYDGLNTIYEPTYSISPYAFSLPQARGYGNLPDMVFALMPGYAHYNALAPRIDQLIQLDFATAVSDPAATNALMLDIIYAWAGVNAVDPSSRGIYIDARQVEFLEVLTGQPFLQRGWSPDPFYYAAQDLQQSFDHAFDAYTSRLLMQTIGTELFDDSIIYDLATDTMTGGQTLNATKLNEIETIALASSDPLAIWAGIVGMIEFSVGTSNLDAASTSALDAAISASNPALDLAQVVTSLAWQSNVGASFVGTNIGEVMTGGAGDDTLLANHGDDTVNGGLGADVIDGGGGDDQLHGELGADLITGNFGNDTYHYSIGQGVDTYYENGQGAGNDADRILFGAGITLADLTIERVSNADMRISIDPLISSGAIIIENQFNASGQIEFLEFSDGSTYQLQNTSFILDGTPSDDTLYGVRFGGLFEDTINGGDGNDTLYAHAPNQLDFGPNTVSGDAGDDLINGGRGDDLLDGGQGLDSILGSTGNDTLRGGLGDDTLKGGQNDDTYLFDYGDGVDRITEENGIDSIVFGPSVMPAMLSMQRIGNTTLEIKIDGWAGGTILVTNQFNATGVETLVFDDGSSIDLSTLNVATVGTSSDDQLFGVRSGGGFEDTITGGAGDDTIFGYGPNQIDVAPNTIFGEDGNDVLNGARGNDLVDAGMMTISSTGIRGMTRSPVAPGMIRSTATGAMIRSISTTATASIP